MTLLAVVYTSPWDYLLIDRGVWFYGEGVVSSWILGIPLGEYLFFVIQTLGTSLLLFNLGYDSADSKKSKVFDSKKFSSPLILLTAAGIWMVLFGAESSLYIGAILAWSGPVISLQWAYGGKRLVEAKKPVMKTVAISSAYLWSIDYVAIEKSLWNLPIQTRTGFEILGLPLEEAFFFTLTNLMVVQGIILYDWTLKSTEVRSLLMKKKDIL